MRVRIPIHEDGQFRTHVCSTLHCVPSLSKTACFHCSIHMTIAVDMGVKLNHSLTHSHSCCCGTSYLMFILFCAHAQWQFRYLAGYNKYFFYFQCTLRISHFYDFGCYFFIFHSYCTDIKFWTFFNIPNCFTVFLTINHTIFFVTGNYVDIYIG